LLDNPFPGPSHYEDYPQLGNGVGSIRQFLQQFAASAAALPPSVDPARTLTWVVGNAVELAFQPVVDQLNAVAGLTVQMAALSSDYWGRDITVTGLLTGHDLLLHLQDRPLGDALLLPTVMLKPSDSGNPEDTLFLDDMSVAEVSRRLNCPVLPIENTNDLVNRCCGELPVAAYTDLQPASGYWVPS
jgi:putative radical SAM enzyme (TIGR03279 family)